MIDNVKDKEADNVTGKAKVDTVAMKTNLMH